MILDEERERESRLLNAVISISLSIYQGERFRRATKKERRKRWFYGNK